MYGLGGFLYRKTKNLTQKALKAGSFQNKMCENGCEILIFRGLLTVDDTFSLPLYRISPDFSKISQQLIRHFQAPYQQVPI